MKSLRQNKKAYQWALLCAAIFLMIGCASHQKVEPLQVPTSLPQNLVKKITIEDTVEGKKVIIEGGAPLPYTFYRLSPEPLQLMVDIPQSTLSPEAAIPLTVDDSVVQKISAMQRNGDVEVSISLNKLVKYKVQKEGNFLFIVVGKQSPLLAKEEEKKEEAKVGSEMLPTVKEEGIEKELAPAANLVDVFADTTQKDRIILQLKADGQVGDYDSFGLHKPTRLVIDLWKIKRRFGRKAIAVNSSYLKMVRLGDYAKKVRVVLDIPSKTIPSHRIDRVGNTLIIVLGKKEVVAAMAPAVPRELEKETGVKEEEKGVLVPPVTAKSITRGEILGIDFKQLEDKSRIIIVTSAKAPYQISKGTENTVLLDVPGMTVPPKLRRPLDTHEFSSAVLLITPLNIVVGAKKGTQVVVKLRKMVAFDVKQEDDKIYVDFERTEEFKAEKLKPVEVVTVKKLPAEKAAEGAAEVKKEEAVSKEQIAPQTPTLTVPASGEGAGQKIYTGKKITLDFKDADIANILRLFAEVSDLNIIASGDVRGTVTIRLVDVPWDQAFDIVLQANNLGAEKIGNVVRIVPLERLSAERKVRAEATKAREEIEPLVTEVIPINYGKVKEIGDAGIKPILSSRGKVVVDERTNTLIVTDIRSNVEKAKLLVRTLDAQTPQVLIQAQVIEANLDFSRELGIQWGGAFIESKNITGSVKGASGGITAPGSSTGSGDLAVNLPAAVTSGAGGAVQFALANLTNTKYLQVRISALESTGQGRIISSPRLTTLDNTEASIEQGLRIPYPKQTAEGTVSVDFIEANLKLTVTPHVTADGYIRMELDVKKDTPDTSITVEGTPSIDKKEVKTEVLVKDGEVVVIGGIYTYTKTTSTDAVPFVYKIPLLGWLFQKRAKADNKRELLVFIAPTIVQPRRIITQ